MRMCRWTTFTFSWASAPEASRSCRRAQIIAEIYRSSWTQARQTVHGGQLVQRYHSFTAQGSKFRRNLPVGQAHTNSKSPNRDWSGFGICIVVDQCIVQDGPGQLRPVTAKHAHSPRFNRRVSCTQKFSLKNPLALAVAEAAPTQPIRCEFDHILL